MSDETCAKCGEPRPVESASGSERQPCLNCGESAFVLNRKLAESIPVSDEYSAELIPGKQVRDWEQRWTLILSDLKKVISQNTEAMSQESIHSSLQQLNTFFIQVYSLKDALKHGTSVKGSDIEDAISNDPRLALLADLANLDKHTKLTKTPRSGYIPSYGQVSGVYSSTGCGWYLCLKVNHKNTELDGLLIAQKAVSAWEEKLTKWGLI